MAESSGSVVNRTEYTWDEKSVENFEFSRLRISVGWSFGDMKRSWPYVVDRDHNKTNHAPVAARYAVAVLLCNLKNCLHPNQISKYFNSEPLDISVYLKDVDLRPNIIRFEKHNEVAIKHMEFESEYTGNEPICHWLLTTICIQIHHRKVSFLLVYVRSRDIMQRLTNFTLVMRTVLVQEAELKQKLQIN
ncbi:unnamed protein product [Ambrosiozyma monospora]|uniref:Unnamed protein product n=1 Tax=Ambrosiozyma monospora TaxID=43982 RepID=A0ACB5U4K8_AMBMO|nr:unnamed protein product [Ambrosiozyma monospora]